jgi:hypothetical protein
LKTKPSLILVHENCRKNFTNKRRYEQYCEKQKVGPEVCEEGPSRKSLHSSLSAFNWNSDCFICNEYCDFVNNKITVRRVETLEIRDHILDVCMNRDDELAMSVKSRLLMCADLPAVEAVYHKSCHTSFLSCSMFDKRGRPMDIVKSQLFDKLCMLLEMSGDLMTVDELTKQTCELEQVELERDVYCKQYIKNLLVEKYEQHIFYGQAPGRMDIVCLRNMASYIVNNHWYTERKKDAGDEGERIVLAAAKLIKCEIREALFSTDSYPTPGDISNATVSFHIYCKC